MEPVKNEKTQNTPKKPCTAEEWMDYFEEQHWNALGFYKNKKNQWLKK